MKITANDASRRLLPPGVEWSGPSRRARATAAALAVLLAVLTAVVVSLAWKRTAPPPAPRRPVEVKLIASPSPAPALTRPLGVAASSAAR